ncbi:hypothetical protein METBIDRAFT_10124 [Metschnikowia bicuspidata var. bicuspidata NRRL YB-4993]|uniref:Carboxymuconolactone decarboxylase-like domain-containing protein n=1 Tax=Metschnikowia bicuspidata var. bicuspidata NRRL YB-4993 TaxID=869754 RepID=A0A1A0HJ54_9ASCO|nr:hypothetical protein METBIDRAFT_10124 [Metschnikowia bicuspidata var. bicuspidata NRRL YB-4993]OBA23917.1 hypothetical protein METBIDRAFT_10124 [Metschnikowia bicuspidata var. bicuspidata NRRL YB-4993]
MTILTAERLVKLAYKYPGLYTNWYIFASTALTVVNQPQEIGKVFHFALRQQLLAESSSTEKSLLTDYYLLKLAEDSIASAAKYQEFSDIGTNLPDILVPYTYYDKLPLPYKFIEGGDIRAAQNDIASKIREAILKIAPISGLPKSINALTALKNVTPNSLKPEPRSQRPQIVYPGHVSSSALIQEDVAGTRFEGDTSSTFDTIEGPISLSSTNCRAVLENTVRGSEFWSAIYGKIKQRVRNQLYDAYPDLWQYAYHHVYSPILSYTKVLNPKETSLCVICALIPQDVNPTLKGHLKGALNVGAPKLEIEEIRLMTFDICDWSGNIAWKGGKESVAKL